MHSFIDRISARAVFRAPPDGPAGTLGVKVVGKESFNDGAVAADMLEDGVAPSFANLAALTADTIVTAGAPLGARVRLDEHSGGGNVPALLQAVASGSPNVIGTSDGGSVRWRVAGAELDVRMFGAKGDGVADDRAAIQAAEDACAALATERGGRMTLKFPAGTYALGDTVLKRAGVNWRVSGEIRRKDAPNPTPTGTQYALVLAQNVDNWSIEGGVFRAITHRKVQAVALPRKNNNSNPGNTNACIHASNCKNWVLRHATFRDYSNAVFYQGCANFRIESNEFEDGSGETIESMRNGTYALAYTATGTGAISHGTIATGPAPVSSNFAITGNVIRNPGLDIAIEALNQAWDAQPGLVANNVIYGTRSGIQIYRGSFTDPGNAATYEARLLIEGNYIFGTWEQGIYIRGVTGIRIAGNVIHYPGLVGSNGSGSSAGGIVTRVNPFNPQIGWASAPSLSDKPGIDIEANTIQNSGRPGVASDGAIQVRVPNTRVRGNRIVRDDKLFTALEGTAIVIGSGEMTGPYAVEGNEIVNYARGVAESNTLDAAPRYGIIDIRGNRISFVTAGIDIDGLSPTPRRIEGNSISDFVDGVVLRSAPFASVERNILSKGTNGLRIRSGCLASDVAAQLTAGATSGSAVRRGGTIQVRGNTFRDVTTPHTVTETNGDDSQFYGRCAVWEGDTVNGAPVDGSTFASASPATTFNVKTWRRGDRVRNTTIAPGVIYERICTSSGTNGGAGTTTGATTSGSAVVTSVASWNGIGPGMFLMVGGQRVLVVSIDPAANRFTTDFTFSSTASGVTIDRASPVFANLYFSA